MPKSPKTKKEILKYFKDKVWQDKKNIYWFKPKDVRFFNKGKGMKSDNLKWMCKLDLNEVKK